MSEFNFSKVIFSKVELPEFKPKKISNGNYYITGKNDRVYDDLISIYNGSAVHKSFVDNLAEKTKGSGIITDNDEDKNSSEYYNLDKVFSQLCFDQSMYGGFAIEVSWDLTHKKIVEIDRLDVSRIRIGFVDPETDRSELYYYSNDWKNWKDRQIDIVQTFDPDAKQDDHQVFYFKTNSPGNIYPTPIYYSGLHWAYADQELGRYYANLIKHNFTANTIISLNNGVPDPEKMIEFETSIKENFTSSDNGGSIMIVYNDNKENAPEILSINNEGDDEKYNWLSREIIDRLIIAHRIPSPMLAGVRVAGTLGGRDELEIANHLYNVNVVYPYRDNILKTLEELNKYFIYPLSSFKVNDIPVMKKNNVE